MCATYINNVNKMTSPGVTASLPNSHRLSYRSPMAINLGYLPELESRML